MITPRARTSLTKRNAGEDRVRTWLEIGEALERQLEPLGRVAIDRLQLVAGHEVLDIGCGIGGTSSAMAQIVGPRGKVVGIDALSAAVDVMQSRTTPQTTFSVLHGDAETYPFASGSFDAAFSRFGIMFFKNSVNAFSNIRRALRPGGRIAFVCWCGLEENELDKLPIRAAAPHLPTAILSRVAQAEHFKFANPSYLRDVLINAGYADIDICPHDKKVRSGSLLSMLNVCSRVGSLGALLREYPTFYHQSVEALKRALVRIDGPGGPALTGAIWAVTATAPHPID